MVGAGSTSLKEAERIWMEGDLKSNEQDEKLNAMQGATTKGACV